MIGSAAGFTACFYVNTQGADIPVALICRMKARPEMSELGLQCKGRCRSMPYLKIPTDPQACESVRYATGGAKLRLIGYVPAIFLMRRIASIDSQACATKRQA